MSSLCGRAIARDSVTSGSLVALVSPQASVTSDTQAAPAKTPFSRCPNSDIGVSPHAADTGFPVSQTNQVLAALTLGERLSSDVGIPIT